ncbi:Flp1 family type IVb pilin [Butyrivibrio sp. JL13D10]|uniref:Flp1 family type IVb pilin n=1 Tax=Butyrivibrio sp. JL13D10 TaxID=3236815 RepID=UPI0038B62A46
MNYLVLDAEFAVKRALNKVFREENGEVNIVTMVVMIGIAVMLATFFKEEIGRILKTLLGNIEGKATDAMTTPVG